MTPPLPVGVIMLSPSFYPHVGGAEKQALELSKTLQGLGVRVEVVTREREGLPSCEDVSGVPVHRLFSAGDGLVNALTFLFSAFLFLVRRARTYDVIHVHLAGSPAVAACLAGLLFSKRVVIKVGGGRGIGEIATSGATLSGRWKLMFLKAVAPSFISVTEDLKKEMEEFGFRKNVRVIPNGVDTGRYRPANNKEEKDALRKTFGWPKGTCFLYVGRLAKEKQLDMFLEAFKDACLSFQGETFCVFAGGGEEEARLQEKVRVLGMEKRVYFVPPTDKIEKLYRAADVFILPSISEGLSNALLEAMASGLPILGSHVGGTLEAVDEGKTGILFSATEPAELRQGVLDYLKNPERTLLLGEAARRVALERYSLESVARRYMEAYA